MSNREINPAEDNEDIHIYATNDNLSQLSDADLRSIRAVHESAIEPIAPLPRTQSNFISEYYASISGPSERNIEDRIRDIDTNEISQEELNEIANVAINISNQEDNDNGRKKLKKKSKSKRKKKSKSKRKKKSRSRRKKRSRTLV